VRPNDGCGFRIDANLSKKGRIAERFQNTHPRP
jgi:hypothetical protein